MEPSTSTRPTQPRPTLLMVGRGEPLDLALKLALDRNGLDVEMCGLEELERAAPRLAADAVLLVGDAAEDGGEWAVHVLSEAPGAESTPVVVLVDDGPESRLRAFRHGALAVVNKSESADQIAKRIAGLADQLATPFEERTGEVGSASFDDLIDLVRSEQRSGILTVHASTHASPLRVVLGAGRPVAEAVREFVARLQPLVSNSQQPMYYQFHSATGGSVDLVDLLDAPTPRVASRGLAGVRMLLVDDDAGRTEALAQALRARGAEVLTDDSSGSGLRDAADLDPHLVLIDKAGLEGAGFQVVRVLRNDPRLRWASVMVANWDEIIGSDGRVTVDPLVARIEPTLSSEQELRSRAERETAFDARLEATGPGRLLRILAETGATFHLRVRNQKASIDVDVAQGLVVGAVAKTTVPEQRRFAGPAALAALLALTSARVRVERRIKPEIANIMRPVGDALSAATGEPPPFAASSMPPPISVGADEASGETTLADAAAVPFDPADASGTRARSGISSPPAAPARESRRSPRPRSMTLMGGAAAGAPPPGNSAPSAPPAVATFARPPAEPPPPPPTAARRPAPPAPPAPASPPVPAQAAPHAHAPPPPPPQGPPPAPPVTASGSAWPRTDDPTARVPAAPQDPRARMSHPAEGGWTAGQPRSAPAGAPVPLPTAAEPVAPAPPTTLRARPSALRGLAVLSVLGSSLVLAGVVGLVAYRYSGLRVEPVDQLLGLLGSPLVTETAAARPSTDPAAEKPPAEARGEVDAPVGPAAPAAMPASVSPSAAEAAETEEPPSEEPAEPVEELPAPPNELPSAAEAAEQDPAETPPVETAPVADQPVAEVEPEAPADVDANDVDEMLRAAAAAGRGARAERLYRQVLEREPQEHHAAVGLARILMGRTQYREAVGLMELAVRRRPRRVSYLLLLGEARAGSGDRAGAQEAWRQALSLDPDNRTAQRLLRR